MVVIWGNLLKKILIYLGMKHKYECDTEVNLCYSSPCLNGGTCVRREGGFSCLCKEEFTGKSILKKCLYFHTCLVYNFKGKDSFLAFHGRPILISDVSKERDYLGPITNHTFMFVLNSNGLFEKIIWNKTLFLLIRFSHQMSIVRCFSRNVLTKSSFLKPFFDFLNHVIDKWKACLKVMTDKHITMCLGFANATASEYWNARPTGSRIVETATI